MSLLVPKSMCFLGVPFLIYSAILLITILVINYHPLLLLRIMITMIFALLVVLSACSYHSHYSYHCFLTIPCHHYSCSSSSSSSCSSPSLPRFLGFSLFTSWPVDQLAPASGPCPDDAPASGSKSHRAMNSVSPSHELGVKPHAECRRKRRALQETSKAQFDCLPKRSEVRSI